MGCSLKLNAQKFYENGIKKHSIFLVTAVFILIAMFYSVNAISVVDKAHLFIRILSICYIGVAGTVLCIALKKVKELHNLYLVFVVVLGIAYFTAVPLGRIPDEPIHYSRIYELSEGTLVTPILPDGSIGNLLPKNFNFLVGDYRSALNCFDTFLDYENRGYVYFPASALYSPLCYIPQTLGVIFFRIFTNNAAVIFYGARLFNFIFGAVATYFSIKIIPYGKLTVFVIALMPMVMHQMISVSADVPTNALALFSVALALYMAEPSVKIKKRYLALFATSILILSFCKIVYIVFAVLVFLIPKDKFKNVALGRVFKISLVTGVILAEALWMLYTTRYFIPIRDGVSMAEQIKFVLSNPFEYIKILFKTVSEMLSTYVLGMVGNLLGYLDINCGVASYGVYLLVLFIVIFVLAEFVNCSVKTKLFAAFVFVCTAVLIFSALYVQWTPVANSIVEGVQGRYFIPILLPLALFAPKVCGKKANEFDYSGRLAVIPHSYYLFILVMFSNFITLVDLLSFYIK